MGVDGLSSLEGDGNDGDVDRTGDADIRAYFDGSFDTRLDVSASHIRARVGSWTPSSPK